MEFEDDKSGWWVQALLESYRLSRLGGAEQRVETLQTQDQIHSSSITSEALPQRDISEFEQSAQPHAIEIHTLPEQPSAYQLPPTAAHAIEELCAAFGPSNATLNEDMLSHGASNLRRSGHKHRIVLVGNGPMSSAQRASIDSASIVVRFNAIHNRFDPFSEPVNEA